MKNDCYDSEELKMLHHVLEEIILEAKERALDMPVDDIIERMFDLADRGERNPAKLRDAIFRRAA